MRPFQGLLRAEIAARGDRLWAEKKRLDVLYEQVQAELDAALPTADEGWDGEGIASPSTRLQLQANRKHLELNNAISKILKEVQDLEFEITVRDNPDLVKQLGAGAD